jgi:DNA/RNA endonuclease YhcR with UshA esterase domain
MAEWLNARPWYHVSGIASVTHVYLDNGSGEVMLLLWQNVFERVPDGADLVTVGNRLRVVGRVEEYQGTLQVVPALPFDIQAAP